MSKQNIIKTLNKIGFPTDNLEVIQEYDEIFCCEYETRLNNKKMIIDISSFNNSIVTIRIINDNNENIYAKIIDQSKRIWKHIIIRRETLSNKYFDNFDKEMLKVRKYVPINIIDEMLLNTEKAIKFQEGDKCQQEI